MRVISFTTRLEAHLSGYHALRVSRAEFQKRQLAHSANLLLTNWSINCFAPAQKQELSAYSVMYLWENVACSLIANLSHSIYISVPVISVWTFTIAWDLRIRAHLSNSIGKRFGEKSLSYPICICIDLTMFRHGVLTFRAPINNTVVFPNLSKHFGSEKIKTKSTIPYFQH